MQTLNKQSDVFINKGFIVRYLGSKRRIIKQLLPIILKDRKADQHFVEPFAGGCNVTEHITGNVIANDNNQYLITMYQAMQAGWTPPGTLPDLAYKHIKDHKENYPPEVVGFAGLCSFGGKFFGGYARTAGRDQSAETSRGIIKQSGKLRHINFICGDYQALRIPKDSIVYCDAPYANTTKYKQNFDYERYYEWLRLISKRHTVYISEYFMPDDFKCILEVPLTINVQGDKVKSVTERLFKYINL